MIKIIKKLVVVLGGGVIKRLIRAIQPLFKLYCECLYRVRIGFSLNLDGRERALSMVLFIADRGLRFDGLPPNFFSCGSL